MRLKRLSYVMALSSCAMSPEYLLADAAMEATVSDSSETKASSQPLKLKDVVVTATKEGEVSLQKVPLGITAFSDIQLEDSGAKNIEDLKLQTPGFNVTRNGQAARLYIRGIGTNLDFVGADPSVTVHVDGVYQSRATTALDEFLEVERVEILRGPQGTLYGRNSTGGTINIITKLPQAEPKAKVSAEIGTYNTQSYMAAASGPVAGDQLLGGIAVLKTDHDPYVDNFGQNGVDGLVDDDSLSTRGTLRYLMGNQGEIILRADYTDIDRATGAYKPTGLTTAGAPSALAGAIDVPADPFKINISYANPFVEHNNWGTSAEVDYKLSPSLTLVSLTGYRDTDFHTIEDTDGSNMDVMVTEVDDQQEQLSEELRLHYVVGRLSVVTGLYYLNDTQDSNTTVNVNISGVANNFVANNETDAYAVFGQGTYALTSQLNTTLGLRYSAEEKTFRNVNKLSNTAGTTLSSFVIDETQDWDAWSPKAGIDYSFEQGPMLYGSVSQGFKSGGFNFTSADPGYDPETVWSYEVGAKMDWMQNQLRSNLVLFYYDYTDLQVSDFTQPGVLSISNAADATVQGIEIENQWVPSPDWLLEFNYAYLDATYDKYLAPAGAVTIDVSGNQLNAAPKHKFNLATQYFQEVSHGTLSYRVEYSWQDKQYFTAFNQEVSSQGAFGIWNARIAYHSMDEAWELQAYAENLADEDYSTSSREFPSTTVGVTKDINAPRTFGAKLVYHFM